MRLKSITVHVALQDIPVPGSPRFSLVCTPQEAFNLLMMPSLNGRIVSLVPEYEIVPNELSEVSEKED